MKYGLTAEDIVLVLFLLTENYRFTKNTQKRLKPMIQLRNLLITIFFMSTPLAVAVEMDVKDLKE